MPLLAAVLGLLPGCANLLQGMAPELRTMQAGGKAHAYMVAATIYSFADGSSLQWNAALDKLEKDALPLLRFMNKRGHGLELDLKDYEGPASVATYELDLIAVAKGTTERHVLPGKPGTDPEIYDQALQPAAEALGMNARVLQDGHFALYALVPQLTTLNATHDTIKNSAFRLLVLREKLEQGQTQVDPMDPNRPKEESLADIHMALRLIEDEHRRINEQRAGILALLALAQSYAQPDALALLEEQLAASRRNNDKWRATHRRPTADDYGVAPAALPTPASIMKDLDEKLGFIGALAKVAQGVVSGDPSATLEGLAKLAPEDSSIGTALDGLAAATRGDVEGTIDAVAELAGVSESVDEIKGRLEQVQGLVDRVK